jgi:hypothetical protein
MRECSGGGSGLQWLERARQEGTIRAFGAGVNSAEGRDEAATGINPTVTLGKQLLNMIGNLL